MVPGVEEGKPTNLAEVMALYASSDTKHWPVAVQVEQPTQATQSDS